jgi:phage gpG-like protein
MKFKDNSKAAKKALKDATIQWLIQSCIMVEGQAVLLVKTDTSRLKGSIDHYIDEEELEGYVGTNVEYSVFVEFGTGEFAENGMGRKGYWVYVADGGSGKVSKSTSVSKTYTLEEAKRIMAIMQSKGIDAHISNGIHPKPFLRPAFREHKKSIESLAEEIFNQI